MHASWLNKATSDTDLMFQFYLPYPYECVFTPVAVAVKGHRLQLVEKVKLLKTTEKLYAYVADKIRYHWTEF